MAISSAFLHATRGALWRSVAPLLTLLGSGIALAQGDADDESRAMLWVAALAGTLAALLATWRYREAIREGLRKPAPPEKRLEGFESRELVELLELAADWAWKTDDAHRYTHVTAGLSARSLMDPADFIGRAPWELVGDDAVEHWDAYRRSVAREEPVSRRISRRDRLGARRHIELVGVPLYGAAGFAGYHGVARDVTPQVDTERALHENQIRYQEVIESISEVIFRTDASGRLTFLNRAWERIFGHPVRASIGRPLAEFLHPDDQAAVGTELRRVLGGDAQAYAGQFRLRMPNGEIRWIEATAHPVPRRDAACGPEGLAGTLFDVTVRKIAELTLRNLNQELEARVQQRTAELAASNRELEAFSYSVSHDLRAPLRAIEGFARILEDELDERLDAQSHGHILRIRNASQRMARLIDDLLQLAQLTRQPLHTETFDLSALAVEILDELAAAEPARDARFDVAPGLVVTADRSLVQVALENLLGNAWKFSSARAHTQISLTAERDRDRLVFCVADNGAGFDMAYASKLFRPFHRLHGSAQFPGSGIGLANVQRIVMRHGGQIWAQAKPDEGAKFYFTLGR